MALEKKRVRKVKKFRQKPEGDKVSVVGRRGDGDTPEKQPRRQ